MTFRQLVDACRRLGEQDTLDSMIRVASFTQAAYARSSQDQPWLSRLRDECQADVDYANAALDELINDKR